MLITSKNFKLRFYEEKKFLQKMVRVGGLGSTPCAPAHTLSVSTALTDK